MRLESLCRHLQSAVVMHLRLLSEVDFTEREIQGWMPEKLSDETFSRFLLRCPELAFIYGLHPRSVAKRRQRGTSALSVPGIVDALGTCSNLLGVETCNLFVMEAILNDLPDIEILGTFRNRERNFPIEPGLAITLRRNPPLTSLDLTGVEIPELPRMDALNHLRLKWVRFTAENPFRDFIAPNLRTFIMNNCIGPLHALKYVALVTNLVAARHLSCLEMVRVPFLGKSLYVL